LRVSRCPVADIRNRLIEVRRIAARYTDRS
jgi:hypothetical protein